MGTRKGKRKWNERSFVQACILRSIQQAKGGGRYYTTKFMPGILEPVAFLAEQSKREGFGLRHLNPERNFDFLYIGMKPDKLFSSLLSESQLLFSSRFMRRSVC